MQTLIEAAFTTGRGKVVKYDPQIQGVWETYINENGKPAVKRHLSADLQVLYTPLNIVWIKNVTNSEVQQAYLDITDDNFILNFPTKHKQNVLSPAIGELILVYQKVNGVAAFTHLVTPIDDNLDDKGIRPEYLYGRNVRVIARATADDFIPVASTMWAGINFAGFSQGNACKIDNIKQITNADELRLEIWGKFAAYFLPEHLRSLTFTEALLNEVQHTDSDVTVTEGGLKLVSHFAKERNQRIVSQKKAGALKSGLLHCEICTFSFPKVFNAEFIECHHLDPIAEGGVRETKLEDLLLVCPNCHRMLHRKFDGKYLSPQELKGRMMVLATGALKVV